MLSGKTMFEEKARGIFAGEEAVYFPGEHLLPKKTNTLRARARELCT